MDSLRLAQQILHVQEEDDPIQKAQKLKLLHEDHGIAYSYLAQEMEVSPAYISNYLRLLRLPDLVLDGYYTGTISLTHLFILARIKDPEQIVALYEQILSKEMSALDLEEAVRNILYGTKSEGDPIEKKASAAIERKIKAIDPDAQVKIIQTRVKSKVVIELKGNRSKTSDFLRKLSEE
jgi:hypothetical protein